MNSGIVLFEEQIKPCPFCGKDPVMVKDIRYPRPECKATDAYEIMCNTLGCPIYKADNTYFFSQHAAAAAWNTRVLPEPTKEEGTVVHVCSTCKWRSDDFTSVCTNGGSEHRADFVDADDSCECWEERKA